MHAYSEGHNGGRAGPVDREGARMKNFQNTIRVPCIWVAVEAFPFT